VPSGRPAWAGLHLLPAPFRCSGRRPRANAWPVVSMIYGIGFVPWVGLAPPRWCGRSWCAKPAGRRRQRAACWMRTWVRRSWIGPLRPWCGRCRVCSWPMISTVAVPGRWSCCRCWSPGGGPGSGGGGGGGGDCVGGRTTSAVTSPAIPSPDEPHLKAVPMSYPGRPAGCAVSRSGSNISSGSPGAAIVAAAIRRAARKAVTSGDW
jgi:hypothetical protein